MAPEPVEPPRRRWRPSLGSVRVRTTGAAVLVVTVALVVAGAILVSLVRSQLTDQVRAGAKLRSGDVAAALNSGTPPESLAVSDDEDLIQVVAGDGSVVASSRNVRGQPAVADLDPGQTKSVDRVPIEDGSQGYLIVATGARVDGRRVTVLVARTDELIRDSTRFVTRLLTIGIPVLVLVVGATTYLLTGRALAPVEAMRAEVDEISGSELHRRVPEPPGTDEIGRLARTMNRMLGRVEAAAIAQRRFAADASHELRSPVATIRQHAEVALAHPDRTTTMALAEVVLAEDLRVQQLVEDLLLLARTEEGGTRPNWHAVDLDDLVLDEAKRIRSTTDLRVDMRSVSAGRVEGDEAHLRRVVRNLVDNAVRHGEQQVRLSLVVEDEIVVLSVEDDGTGVAEVDRDRIFERFVRLDEARSRDQGGSGLGLAIVKDLVDRHGGTVRVGPSDLGGAAFKVMLPAAPDDL